MERESLLKEKKQILTEMQNLGEMRSGTLSIRYQKCSTQNCICKTTGHPGHGPIYELTYYDEQGKYKSRNYKEGKLLDILRQQIENYRKYKELSKQYLKVSTQLSLLSENEAQESPDVKKNLSKKSRGSFGKKPKELLKR